MSASASEKRERLKRWPLITFLILFISILVVGFTRNTMLLALWVAAWGTYGVVRLAFWLRKKL